MHALLEMPVKREREETEGREEKERKEGMNEIQVDGFTEVWLPWSNILICIMDELDRQQTIMN